MYSAFARPGTLALSVLLVVACWLMFPLSSADARHEVELAKGLADDFRFYDLAKEVLVGKGGTPGNPGGALKKAIAAGDKEAQAEIALALNSILLRHAGMDPSKANELRAEAGEWLSKFAGGGLNLWAAKLEEAGNFSHLADQESDPEKKAELLSRARTTYGECAQGYRQEKEKLYQKNLGGQLTPEENGDLKLAWYYWCQCLYELAKLGVDRDTNLEQIYIQLDEMMFEWDGEVIAFYGMLLKGDAYALQRQWGKAESEYTGVTGLPVTIPNIDAAGQKTLNELRMQGYYKMSQALLAQDSHDRLINLINKMFSEYPDNTTAKEMKLCNLLRAESQVKLMLEQGMGRPDEIEKVINSLARFQTDPEAYFRFKYYEMLANIGRTPGLTLELRLRCGRAAFDSFKYKEAAEIYQLILSALRVTDRAGNLNRAESKKNFERYAPEAYYRLGESLSQQWRFFEAGYVYYHAARQFQYFVKTYKDIDQLPAHMRDGDSPFFSYFDDPGKVASFPLELARKARTCITGWSPAGRNPNDPDEAMDHSVEALWARRVTDLADDIQRALGDDLSALEKKAFSTTWNEAYRPQFEAQQSGGDYDYHEAIGGFNAIKPIIGWDLYFQAAQFSSDLMRRMYDKLNGRDSSGSRQVYREPFTEPLPEDQQGNYNNIYQWEWDRVRNKEILSKLPDNHRRELLVVLANIIGNDREDRDFDIPEIKPEWETADNGRACHRLLWWLKARYFTLKFFYLMLDRRAEEIAASDPRAWDRTIGQVLGSWCTLNNQELERLDAQSGNQIRARVRDIAYAAWAYGMLVRNGPWTVPPSNNPDNIGWLYRSDPPDVKAECEKRDEAGKAACLDIWRDFQSNYSPAFADPENEEKHARQRLGYQSLVRGLLYLSFYLHIKKRNPAMAENVMQAFNLAFPEQEEAKELASASGTRKDMLEQNQRWRLEFVKTIAQTYESANYDENKLFQEAASKLQPMVAKLRGDDEISLKDMRREVETFGLYCWIERKAGNIVCPDEEALMYAYLANHLSESRGLTFIADGGGIDRAAIDAYMAENPDVGRRLFSTVEEMRTYRRENENFFDALLSSDDDVVHLDRDQLLAVLSGEDGVEPEVEIEDINVFAEEAQGKMKEMAKAGDLEGMMALAREFNVDLRYHQPDAVSLSRMNEFDAALESSKDEMTRVKLLVDVLLTAEAMADTVAANKAIEERYEAADEEDKPAIETELNTARQAITAAKALLDDPQDGWEATAAAFFEQMNAPIMDGADKAARMAALLRMMGANGNVMNGEHATEVLQMYGGHQTRVFLQRYRIADAIEAVQVRYTASIVRLDRKSLSYYYRFWQVDQKENADEWDARRRYSVGKRFFQAELWDQSIEYLEPVVKSYEEGESRGKPVWPASDTYPYGLDDHRKTREEVTLRYNVGRAYYEKAILAGSYNPNEKNWREAERHLMRLYHFVHYRIRERQLGSTAPISFEKDLDGFYYQLLDRITRLLELKAEYQAKNGDVDGAHISWATAIQVYYWVGKQSPQYSPDERMPKYHHCRLCLSIAKLGEDKQYNDRLESALKVFASEYRGRQYDDKNLVLHNDPVYDRLMDELYPQVLNLAKQRGLIEDGE